MSRTGTNATHTATKFTLKTNNHLPSNMQTANNKMDNQTVSQSADTQNSAITIGEFLDFLKAAYQVHGNIEGVFIEEGMKETAEWIKAKQIALDRATMFAQSCALDNNLPQSDDGRFKDAAVQGTVCANASALQKKLSEVLNEGLLDSILPYMVPSSTSVAAAAGTSGPRNSSVGVAKHAQGRCATAAAVAGFSGSDGSVNQAKVAPMNGGNGQETNKKPSEKSVTGSRSSKSTNSGQGKKEQHMDEVEIHVCDEVKNVRKDFRCSAALLLAQMGYFAHVTGAAHQRLDEMEISVHCDVGVFEWLMSWVNRENSAGTGSVPTLTPSCAIPVLVSAAFLQMEPLLQDCLLYCHSNMNDILRTNASLSCVNDALLSRLAAMYTNAEVEAIRDRRDKIHSRLYCKLISSLCEPEAEGVRGHYCTLAAAYRCRYCHQLIPHPHIAQHIPCSPAHTRLARDGSVQPRHVRDPLWSLTEHVATTYRQLQHQWRRAYWRLWAEAHHLYCAVCKRYFPAWQWLWCRYHPDPAQFFTLDNVNAAQADTGAVHTLPVGRFPCCGERAYRFQVLDERVGCQFREHTPDTKKIRDAAILSMLHTYKAFVTVEPPHLVFPDRLTRLVAKEDNLDQEEVNLDICKETFWWQGIEILPERDKYGLLGSFLGIYNVGDKQKLDIDPTATLPFAAEHDSTDVDYADSDGDSNSGSDRSGNAQTSSDEEEDSADADGNTGFNSSDPDDPEAPRKPADQLTTANNKRIVSGKRIAKKGKTRGKKGKTDKLWQHCSSARSNQDMQRCHEEIAFKRINAFLTRKTEFSAETTTTTNHHRPPIVGVRSTGGGSNGSGSTPVGGLWAKLERNWRDACHGHQMTSAQQQMMRHNHHGNKAPSNLVWPTSTNSKNKQCKASKLL